MKSIDEITSSSEDEYGEYDKRMLLKHDLKIKSKIVDGVEYDLHEDSTLTDEDGITIGRWNGKCVEWISSDFETQHMYHKNYSSELA